MSKKILRLNESQLIEIISESVQAVLNELDWKTYQNAANKDYNPIRAREFSQAALDKFNSEYAYDDENGNTVSLSPYNKTNNYLRATSKYSPNSTLGKKDILFHSPSTKDNTTDDFKTYTKDSSSLEKNPFTMDKRHARKIAKAYDEFNNYRNGKSTYEKNKGWTKPEKNSDFHDFLKY